MINSQDLKLLWSFTLRISMYTGVENKETIAAFLHGYEEGRGRACDFTERLSQSIAQQYRIPSRATGWPGQIHLVAEKLGTDWTVVFKQQSLKVLSMELPGADLEELYKAFRKRIHSKVSNLRYFGKGWINEWLGIVDLGASWFQEIWTDSELQMIEDIDSELKVSANKENPDEGFQTSDRLRDLCERLNAEMDLREYKT